MVQAKGVALVEEEEKEEQRRKEALGKGN